jgi:hypothetical protein
MRKKRHALSNRLRFPDASTVDDPDRAVLEDYAAGANSRISRGSPLAQRLVFWTFGILATFDRSNPVPDRAAAAEYAEVGGASQSRGRGCGVKWDDHTRESVSAISNVERGVYRLAARV